MVDVPKTGEKPPVLPENNTVIMSSVQIKPEDVEIEHENEPGEKPIEQVVTPRKQKSDALEEMREKMKAQEDATTAERERRLTAERERDAAKSQIDTTRATLAKNESEKVAAQESALMSRVEDAKTKVENAERALEDAIDTGKPAREQIALQKRLADSVYTLRGAEAAQTHFTTWKEAQKNKPAPVVKQADDNITPAAKKWIDDHPRYNTDKKYRRTAIAAHEDALDDGVAADSNEYFRRINMALAEAGLEGDGEPTVARKVVSGTSTAAPVNHDSAMQGARGGQAAEEQRTGRKIFRLDANMRTMAIQTYGKNSNFKLSDEEAYKRYAAKQIEIREKRANGEIK